MDTSGAEGVTNKYIAYVDIIKSLCRNTSYCIKTTDGCTDMFSTETGVCQGCSLSPVLIILVIDFIIRKAMNGPNVGVKRINITLTDLIKRSDSTFATEWGPECGSRNRGRLAEIEINWNDAKTNRNIVTDSESSSPDVPKGSNKLGPQLINTSCIVLLKVQTRTDGGLSLRRIRTLHVCLSSAVHYYGTNNTIHPWCNYNNDTPAEIHRGATE